MSVKKIMSSPVSTIDMDDRLSKVNELFLKNKFHHLLVVKDDMLFGVVSDRDLLKALSPNLGTTAEKRHDKATYNKRVHQVMNRDPICIEQHHSIHAAIALFLEKDITCIPVVDKNKKPVGIVSWRDILKVIQRPQVPKID